MRKSTYLAASIVCLLTATSSHALTWSYGQREIAEAGVGCVGGLRSAHGNVAYFVGDTESLNEQLAMLEALPQSKRSVTVILHAGGKTVDASDEEPLMGFVSQARSQMSIDWSVNKACPFDRVAMGLCKCEERNVTVHIWIANQIRVEDLIVPTEFVVRSAGEIDDFVKQHAERN